MLRNSDSKALALFKRSAEKGYKQAVKKIDQEKAAMELVLMAQEDDIVHACTEETPKPTEA